MPPAGGVPSVSFFDGIPNAALADALAGARRRTFSRGQVVVAAGNVARELYVVESGEAEAFAVDSDGAVQILGRMGAGSTIAEMSMLGGSPALATVVARTDLEVWALTDADIDQIATAFPRIYRNIGAIVTERLTQADRRFLGVDRPRTATLVEDGAPPLIAPALAASVAWHTRSPTLLVVATDAPHREVAALAAHARGPRPGSASVRVVPRDAGTSAAEIERAFVADAGTYSQILVCLSNAESVQTRVRLQAGSRPGSTVVSCDGESVEVPPLAAEDLAAVRQGTLPRGSSAAERLGVVARRLAGVRVGIALGAGAAKGWAHVGVLRALERLGLHVDCLAGTSIGGCVAALYAMGYTPDHIAAVLEESRLFRPTLSRKGLLSNAGMQDVIRKHAGDRRIEDLPLPLAIVAADLLEQRAVYFRRGALWQALVASCSIPGLFPAQRIGPWVLVDGGVVDPVPVDIAHAMGADVALGVSLSTVRRRPALEAEVLPAEKKSPSARETLTRSLEILQSSVLTPVSGSTIMITPSFESSPLGLRRFREGRDLAEAGEAAVEAALPQLRGSLPWLAP